MRKLTEDRGKYPLRMFNYVVHYEHCISAQQVTGEAANFLTNQNSLFGKLLHPKEKLSQIIFDVKKVF